MAKGRALLFETSVCPTTLAVIGSAVLTLRLRSSKDQDVNERKPDRSMVFENGVTKGIEMQDADIFAYLRERPPDGGDLVYITEGRAIERDDTVRARSLFASLSATIHLFRLSEVLKKPLGTKGIATRSDWTLLGAPGRTTRNKNATRNEGHRY